MVINPGDPKSRISPLLFGHNLEHTRSSLWRGLSAQLLQNRKFAGGQSHDGVAWAWYGIGADQAWFSLQRTVGRHGTTGEAYVRRYSPSPPDLIWDASRQRQMIATSTSGVPCGIGQEGVCLVKGRQYEGLVCLRADREFPVRIAVRVPGERDAVFEAMVTSRADGWQEHRFSFIARATNSNHQVQITFESPGTLFVGAASLLPSGTFLGMRPDVIELLKEISCPILRWPGGNFAGSYIWKDGLLPVDARAPVQAGQGTLPYTRGWDDHEIGTDEFVALCNELDAEPWITINMSTQGPEEARQWVEYCNGKPDSEWGSIRAKRGHEAPYGVRFWSLGNEMGYGHMAGPNSPEAYGKTASECAESMLSADPSITLVASGAWWKPEWFPQVLAKYGSRFHGVSYHEYTDPMSGYWEEEGRSEFRRVAADADRILSTLQEIRHRLDEHAPGDRRIGISFDEWNTWYNWYLRTGVAEGIYAASILSMLCREAQPLGISIGAYFEPVNEGAIEVTPESSTLTPVGQVLALYRCHHGRRLLPTERPDKSTPLSIVASYDETTREVAVTMVNRHPAMDIEESLVFKGWNSIQAAGIAWRSEDFEPGSRFDVDKAAFELSGPDTIRVSVPAHGIVRLLVTE